MKVLRWPSAHFSPFQDHRQAGGDETRRIQHGTLTSEAREKDGQLELVTLGPDGEMRPFHAARVIGVAPPLTTVGNF